MRQVGHRSLIDMDPFQKLTLHQLLAVTARCWDLVSADVLLIQTEHTKQQRL